MGLYDVGAVGGNQQANELRRMIEALGELGPLAQQFTSETEKYAPGGGSTGNIAAPLLGTALPALMSGGMSSAEETGARRNIGDAFRSAVGAGGFAGGSAGAYSPRATRRVAFREAGQRLAPAIAQLEGQKAKLRRSGLQSGVNALTSIYGTEQAGARQGQQAFGGVLGNLLSGVRGKGRTYGPPIKAGGNAYGGVGYGYNPNQSGGY